MRTDLNGRSPFADLLGRNVLAVDHEAQSVEIEYLARDEFTNRLGILSGGMLSAMLDSVTSVAALATLPDGVAAVHKELKVTYRKMARPGRFAGYGRVVGHDEREIRTHGELRNEAGEVMAEAEAVLRILKLKDRYQ